MIKATLAMIVAILIRMIPRGPREGSSDLVKSVDKLTKEDRR